MRRYIPTLIFLLATIVQVQCIAPRMTKSEARIKQAQGISIPSDVIIVDDFRQDLMREMSLGTRADWAQLWQERKPFIDAQLGDALAARRNIDTAWGVPFRKAHLADLSDHRCDYVVITDDDTDCQYDTNCQVYQKQKFDQTLFGKASYFCMGYPISQVRDTEAYINYRPYSASTHQTKALTNEFGPYFHHWNEQDAKKGEAVAVIQVDPVSAFGSIFHEGKFAGDSLLIPSACISDITTRDLSEIKDGKIAGNYFIYDTYRSMADNCTLEHILEINAELPGNTATDKYNSIFPPFRAFWTTNVNNVHGYRPEAYPACGSAAIIDISRKYALQRVPNFSPNGQEILMERPYGHIVCAREDTSQYQRQIPLIWHTHAWYDRMISVALTAVRALLTEIVEPLIRTIIKVLGTITWEIVEVLVLPLGNLILDSALATLVCVVAVLALIRYVYCASVKLTSTDINVTFSNDTIEKIIEKVKLSESEDNLLQTSRRRLVRSAY